MRTSTLLGLAGIALSISGGSALADWDDVKEAAFSYHNGYDSAYMAYDGEMQISIDFGVGPATCSVAYRYSGYGTTFDVVGRTADPAGGIADQLCGQGEQNIQASVAGGISFSSNEMARFANVFGTETPTKTATNGSLETYSAMVPSSQVPGVNEMAPGTSVTVSLTFDTSNGRFEEYAMETEPFDVQGAPGMSMVATGTADILYMDDGRPYLGHQEFNGNASDTSGQGRKVTSTFVHTATNVSVVTPTAQVSGTKAPKSGFIEIETKGFKRVLGQSVLEQTADGMKSVIADVSARSKDLKPTLKKSDKK